MEAAASGHALPVVTAGARRWQRRLAGGPGRAATDLKFISPAGPPAGPGPGPGACVTPLAGRPGRPGFQADPAAAALLTQQARAPPGRDTVLSTTTVQGKDLNRDSDPVSDSESVTLLGLPPGPPTRVRATNLSDSEMQKTQN